MKQNFQLSTNNNRSYVAYAETNRENEYVIIRNANNTVVKTIHIAGIVFISWLSNEIAIIQSNNELLLYDVYSAEITEKIFLNRKIGMILKSTNDYFDYVTQLSVDMIEVCRYYLEDGVNQAIFTLNTLEFKVKKHIIVKEFHEYMEVIRKKLSIGDDIIEDNFNDIKLRVSNDKLNVKIELNNVEIKSIIGHVDRAYIMREYIIISYSNFLNPRSIYIISLSDKNYDIYDYKGNRMKLSGIMNLEIKKVGMGERKVPGIRIAKHLNCKNALIFLHGGPDFGFRNEYISFLERVLNMRYDIYLIDYSGSTGYGREFYESLFNTNAEEAIQDIQSIIEYLYARKKNIVVAGESFGGYLATVSSIRASQKIRKAISINGFTDFRYQFLFSIAGSIIPKYFDVRSNINNPIDMIKENYENAPLIFIHGEDDAHCPIKQIELFCQQSLTTKCPSKLIRISNQSHFSMSLDSNEVFNSALINQLKF